MWSECFYTSQTTFVKALQGLGMLDVSVVLCAQESVVQWFEDSDEGMSPNETEDEEKQWIARYR